MRMTLALRGWEWEWGEGLLLPLVVLGEHGVPWVLPLLLLAAVVAVVVKEMGPGMRRWTKAR